MLNVQATKTVDVPAARAWEILADFTHVDLFHPMVKRVDMRSEAERGIGATRVCNFHDKTSVVEEITRWQEGESYTVQLSEFSLPLKEAAVTFRVRTTGTSTCEVSMAMAFTPKFGLLGTVMGKLMMRPMIKKMFGQVLAGFSHHALTGEEIGKDWKPTTAKIGAAAVHGS